MTTLTTTMASTDAGGVGAKSGFLYQDYAAALYLIQMLRDRSLLAVRCEVTDDIDLIFNDHEEFVQVKTTDGESKWTLTELCAVTKVKREKGKPKPPPSVDSIVHKSMSNDSTVGKKVRFRILSSRDVRKDLVHLRVEPDKRSTLTERDTLISAISSRIGPFFSPSGRGVEHWVDNTWWEVIPSLELLELRARSEILKAAVAQNIFLEPERDDVAILNSILVTLTKKSALSRKISTVDDKTYARKDFIEWFNKEVVFLGEASSVHRKVYGGGAKATRPILIKFIDIAALPTRSGMAIGQGYERGQYRYKYIAESVLEWLPEILLRPGELADNTGKSIFTKLSLIAERLEKERPELESLIGRVLMHATLRHYAQSEPIPATLYVDAGGDGFKEFENIHIVRADQGDELWLGITEFAPDEDIADAMRNVAEKLEELLSNDFEKQRQKILDVKEDSYLLQHDINDLLDPSLPLDDYIGRFRFVVFIGYKSEHFPLECEDGGNRSDGYISEAQQHFANLINVLIAKDKYFAKLSFVVYLFPNPCVKTLRQSISDKLQSVKYGR